MNPEAACLKEPAICQPSAHIKTRRLRETQPPPSSSSCENIIFKPGLTNKPGYAANIRQARHRPTDRWNLDEMVIVISGRRFYLWRAVNSEGEVLDFLVQSRRSTRAAERLLRKLLKKQGFAHSIMVTDKLGSYGAARKKLGLQAVQEQGLRQNNRCENSHLPVRRREHKQQRFKSPGSAQRFLNVHAAVYNLFNIDRHLTSRRTMKEFRDQAFRQWRDVTAAA